MPLTRRSTARITANIWPGFVDAVTSLLMVMTFVLTIFIVVQYVLREEISGQESRLNELTAEIAGLTQALGSANARVESMTSERDELAAEAQRQNALVSSLQAQIDQQAGRIASFEEQVASLLAQRDEDREAIAGLEGERDTLVSEQEALNLALAQARDEIDLATEEARLAAARREALEALVASLETQADERDETITTLETALSEEEAARLAETAAAEALRERLANSDAELTAMSLALEEQRRQAEETLTLLAAAEAAEEDLDARLAAALLARDEAVDERTQLTQRLSESLDRNAELSEAENQLQAALAALATTRADVEALEASAQEAEANLRAELEEALAQKLRAENDARERLTEAERQAALLATARTELSEQEGLTEESQRQVSGLNAQVAELRQQLNSLQALLDLADEEDLQTQARIESLGQQLNAALAREAIEQRRRAELEAAERERLENYQSEFFGRLREVLGNREGIKIVGDRFVFSSEVLFPSGSATLSAAGRAQVREVATLLTEVADQIPDNIDWVIRVDGHTDDVPVSGAGQFADNWELSQARALSVVRFMAEELGFPQWRLAPTGFGQFRPVDPRQTPEARAANRRIELKLTER